MTHHGRTEVAERSKVLDFHLGGWKEAKELGVGHC